MNNLQYQKKSSKKTTLKIVLLILALVLISGIAYGSWKVLSSRGGEQAKIPDTTPVISESFIQPNIDSTTDWQEYDKSRVGYSIKYPKDFEFTKREESFTKDAITLKKPANGWKKLFIFIEVETYPADFSPREWANWHYKGLRDLSDYENIIINDMQGIKQDLSNSKSTTGEVILTKENKVFRLQYVTEEVQKKDEVIELVNQILNNLKLH